MADEDKDKPGQSAEGRRRAAEREARRAAALRANLRKRKHQQRGRKDGDPPQGDQE